MSLEDTVKELQQKLQELEHKEGLHEFAHLRGSSLEFTDKEVEEYLAHGAGLTPTQRAVLIKRRQGYKKNRERGSRATTYHKDPVIIKCIKVMRTDNAPLVVPETQEEETLRRFNEDLGFDPRVFKELNTK